MPIVNARAAAAVLALALAGCATIGPGQPAITDAPISTSEQEQPADETVDVEQSGTSLVLRARKLCNVVEMRDVMRTTTTPRENKSAWADWTMGVGGAALAGAGAVTLANSGSVASSGTTSRNYNPVGRSGAVAIGAGLAAVGVAGVTVAIVDAVRAAGSDESKARVTLTGQELRHRVTCRTPAPVADVQLALLLQRPQGEKSERLPLGRTDADGVLRIALERVLPREDELSKSVGVSVMRDGREVGTVDPSPLYAIYEEQAWAKAEQERCALPDRGNACDALQNFVAQYPRSAHEPEARGILEKSRAVILVLRDQETWAALNVDACAKPNANSLPAAESACGEVNAYITRFPDGKHVGDAKTALAKNAAAMTRLQEAAKRREQEGRRRAQCRDQCQSECVLHPDHDAAWCDVDCSKKCP